MKKLKKIASMLLALAMIFTSIFTANVGEVKAADGFTGGTYKGTSSKHVDPMQSDITYEMTLVMENGEYIYDVVIKITGNPALATTKNDHYEGTYTVSGNAITMEGQLKSAVIDEAGNLTLTGKLSSFSGGNDSVNLKLEKPVTPEPEPEPEVKPEAKDVLTSGTYELTEES